MSENKTSVVSELIDQKQKQIWHLQKCIEQLEIENKKLCEVAASANFIVLHIDSVFKPLPLTPLYYYIERFNKARQALREVKNG